MGNTLNALTIGNQQLRPFRRYGYVYITTNLVNGKKYIGAHKSSKFDESYKGSGKLLKRAIDKCGWDSFKTEILIWCSSKEELFSTEYKVIEHLHCVEDPSYYNVMPGGFGGDNKSTLTEEDYQKYIDKVSQSKQGRPRTDKEMKHLEFLHQSRIGTHHSEDSKNKSSLSNAGQTRSSTARKNMSLHHADFSGSKNPFHGRTHSEESKKLISTNNARAHKGKVWITDGCTELLVSLEEISNYPKFTRGRIRRKPKR